MDNAIVLRYVGSNKGNHGAIVNGVPACDLTQEMIDASGYTTDELLAFTPPAYAPAQQDDKQKQDGE